MSAPTPVWPSYLNDIERTVLAAIEVRIAADTKERRRLMNLAKQRKHRANATEP